MASGGCCPKHPAGMVELRNYIGGHWVDAEGNRRIDDVNPATGEVIASVPQSSAADVARAVDVAHETFQHWRKVPAPKRAEIMFRVGTLMRERKEDLARKMTREMGKVLVEARGDVQEGIDMAFYMAGEGRRAFGHTTPSELPNKFAMAVRDPIGVAGIITPWNFPMAIPTWKTFPAIVLGNTVVFKPATDTPMLALELVKIFEEAGLPPGVMNLVFGSGSVAGEVLLKDERVRLISFTGSNEVGRHVATEAGAGLKRVSLELGGKNAVIVMDDANLDLALDGIIWSAYGTSGQRCTACSRVIAHEAIHDELLHRLAERVKTLRLGDGLLETTDVGPVINHAAAQSIDHYVEIGKAEGAELLVGGGIAEEGDLAKGSFYHPTLFAGVRPDMRIAQEEIFGPVLSVIKVKDFDEAVQVNNGVTYGLSSSIFTQDVNQVFRAIRDLESGLLYVNAGTTGAEIHLPFGGIKGTGNGHREAGVAALDFFSEWKSVYVDFSGQLQRAQIDN